MPKTKSGPHAVKDGRSSPPVNIDALVQVLQAQDFIDFAVLFGSAATGRMTPMSDIDIGIYVTRDLDLPELGHLITDLERVTQGRDVDVLVVNPLPRTRPALAFESVVKGQLLFARNMERYLEFKTRCMLAYMDTEHLRRSVDEAFRRRVAQGQIGELPRGPRTPETP